MYLDNLKNVSDSKLPVLPYLLDRRNQSVRLPILSPVEQNFKISLSYEEIHLIYEGYRFLCLFNIAEVASQYKMNDDQKAVLEKSLEWFETSDRRPKDSIVLVTHCKVFCTDRVGSWSVWIRKELLISCVNYNAV